MAVSLSSKFTPDTDRSSKMSQVKSADQTFGIGRTARYSKSLLPRHPSRDQAQAWPLQNDRLTPSFSPTQHTASIRGGRRSMHGMSPRSLLRLWAPFPDRGDREGFFRCRQPTAHSPPLPSRKRRGLHSHYWRDWLRWLAEAEQGWADDETAGKGRI